MGKTKESRRMALEILKETSDKCLVCKKKINHPVKRGRKAKFCGSECRIKHRKEWRRGYDAQPYVKAAKSKREMAKYWHAKNEA